MNIEFIAICVLNLIFLTDANILERIFDYRAGIAAYMAHDLIK